MATTKFIRYFSWDDLDDADDEADDDDDDDDLNEQKIKLFCMMMIWQHLIFVFIWGLSVRDAFVVARLCVSIWDRVRVIRNAKLKLQIFKRFLLLLL